MQWNTPDFDEINLSGEVTAYVNTDDDSDVVRGGRQGLQRRIGFCSGTASVPFRDREQTRNARDGVPTEVLPIDKP